METKVLRSAIETYPIVICIPTHDSTLLSNKARIFVCSNRIFVLNMAAMNKVALVTRNLWRKLRDMSAFTTVTVRNSKTETKRPIAGKKIGEKFNLSAAEAEVKLRHIRAEYGRYLKRLKTLPSGPKIDVFGGFEADDDVA